MIKLLSCKVKSKASFNYNTRFSGYDDSNGFLYLIPFYSCCSVVKIKDFNHRTTGTRMSRKNKVLMKLYFSSGISFVLPRSSFANLDVGSHAGIASVSEIRRPRIPIASATVSAPSHAQPG